MTHPLHSPGRRRALFLLCAAPLLASGCGFQLRGPRPLPFESIYLGMYQYSDLAAAIRRQIRAGSTTVIADKAEDAEVRLQVLADTKEKAILALNTQGRVREYQLRQRFTFRLVDKSGQEIMGPSEIFLRRDMQGDLVQQLMRRLAAAKMPAAKPQP
jgi:LPS-assembly lipoprotein